MFDKGVPLGRQWDLQNVDVHPGGLGDSTGATTGLKKASHLKRWKRRQAQEKKHRKDQEIRFRTDTIYVRAGWDARCCYSLQRN